MYKLQVQKSGYNIARKHPSKSRNCIAKLDGGIQDLVSTCSLVGGATLKHWNSKFSNLPPFHFLCIEGTLYFELLWSTETQNYEICQHYIFFVVWGWFEWPQSQNAYIPANFPFPGRCEGSLNQHCRKGCFVKILDKFSVLQTCWWITHSIFYNNTKLYNISLDLHQSNQFDTIFSVYLLFALCQIAEVEFIFSILQSRVYKFSYDTI